MSLNTPGSYVLFHESGSGRPAWPAIVYTDDIAPKTVQCQRPIGYFTLILLITDPFEFRWATTGQLSCYDRLPDSGNSSLQPDLKTAHATASFIREAGLGLAHWQEEVNRQYDAQPVAMDTAISDDAPGSDVELQRALQISMRKFRGSSLSSQCSSTLSRQPAHSKLHQIGNESQEGDDTSWRTSPKRTKCSAAGSLRESSEGAISTRIRPDVHAKYSMMSKLNASSSQALTDTCRQQAKKPKTSFIGSGLDFLSGFHSSLKEPTSDAVEEDLTSSKDMVQIFVGASNELLTAPLHDFWNCTCFRDNRWGINYFRLKENGVYELNHPQLKNIDPEDFGFILEYLSSGDFGHRCPEGEEEVAEAFAQCISTWMTANLIGMYDFLDFITEKLAERIAPWPMWEVMIFSCQLYQPSDQALPAHDKLKALLADFLGEHYWEYVMDESQGTQFLHRLRAIPALELDIQARRFPTTQPEMGFLEDIPDDI